ncbi:hypothetical protein OC842_000386 [Tilletia horrida]|uniref:Uncharacterized protein n=1 Tax=Tilletia horrida TaxID=155126 RepID=A0AAN6GI95_9BASI|nr:hypothetical protein OC842_000386 [Tilletia horrida]
MDKAEAEYKKSAAVNGGTEEAIRGEGNGEASIEASGDLNNGGAASAPAAASNLLIVAARALSAFLTGSAEEARVEADKVAEVEKEQRGIREGTAQWG